MKFSWRITAVLLGVALASQASLALAQGSPDQKRITFNSFTGIYHLNRDSRDLSLLTSEETIVANFPGGYYGITRALPKNYQGHDVNIKILNVSNAAGDQVPFKTKDDANGNLVITTGDPAITLFGSQTIKIRYQTSGVINLKAKTDEFLLNVNGRGWDEPINRLDATLYLPSSLSADLKDKPSCYTSLGGRQNNNCQLRIQKNAENTIISARTQPVAPHQALILKLDFAVNTFNNKHQVSNVLLTILAIVFVLVTVTPAYLVLRRR